MTIPTIQQIRTAQAALRAWDADKTTARLAQIRAKLDRINADIANSKYWIDVAQLKRQANRDYRNDCLTIAGAMAVFLAGLVTICWALW